MFSGYELLHRSEDWARRKANLLSLIAYIGEREVITAVLKNRWFS
jgi:hypothetical protein